MTDIKEYLKYCEGKQATFKAPDKENTFDGELTYYMLDMIYKSEIFTIIPHLRKMESLTEQEAIHMIEMEHDNFEDIKIIRKLSIGGYKYSYRNMDFEGDAYTTATFSIKRFSLAQFHYLTTIGIAWWATPEMWEKGLVIEVK